MKDPAEPLPMTSVVSCVLTKVVNLNRGSGAKKLMSRDLRKKTLQTVGRSDRNERQQ